MKEKKPNYDGDIINTILIIVLLILLLVLVPITMTTELNIPYLWYIIIGIIIVISIRVKMSFSKEKKADKEKQFQYGEIDDNYNSIIYFPKVDKDNLINLAKIISNNKISNFDFITGDTDEDLLYNFFEGNEYIVGIDWKNYLADTVFAINDLCKKLDYNISLSEKDITLKDNENIKNRRRDGIITGIHDINVATDILRKQGYEIIGLWTEGDTHNISIIPSTKIEDMKKIKQ